MLFEKITSNPIIIQINLTFLAASTFLRFLDCLNLYFFKCMHFWFGHIPWSNMDLAHSLWIIGVARV